MKSQQTTDGAQAMAARNGTVSTPPLLGQRLREIRLERAIGVRQLSRAIDCSPSLISQIELGKVVPSVGTLYSLANALDIPMERLFIDDSRPIDEPAVERDGRSATTSPNEDRIIQRGAHRRAIDLEHGVRWELLMPVPEPDVEFMEVYFDVGGGNVSDRSTRHDGREYAVVVEGVLAIQVGFEQFRLESGDSLAFDSMVPHRIWNAGDVRVRAVWLVLGRIGRHEPSTFDALHGPTDR